MAKISLIRLMDNLYKKAYRIAEKNGIDAENETDALEEILISPWIPEKIKSAIKKDVHKLYNKARRTIDNLMPQQVDYSDPNISGDVYAEIAAAQDESLRNYELKAKRIKQLALAGE
jgi:hypothetical protein